MPNVDFLQKSLEMILFIYDDKKKNKKIIDYSFCLDRAPRYKDSTQSSLLRSCHRFNYNYWVYVNI